MSQALAESTYLLEITGAPNFKMGARRKFTLIQKVWINSRVSIMCYSGVRLLCVFFHLYYYEFYDCLNFTINKGEMKI